MVISDAIDVAAAAVVRSVVVAVGAAIAVVAGAERGQAVLVVEADLVLPALLSSLRPFIVKTLDKVRDGLAA